jgi:hypothetical protein
VKPRSLPPSRINLSSADPRVNGGLCECRHCPCRCPRRCRSPRRIGLCRRSLRRPMPRCSSRRLPWDCWLWWMCSRPSRSRPWCRGRLSFRRRRPSCSPSAGVAAHSARACRARLSRARRCTRPRSSARA